MRAVVTGATGFIGSWLVLDLLENNYEVIVVVRNKEKLLPEIINSQKCIVIESEIDSLSLEQFNYCGEIDTFFHLAWTGVSSELKNDVTIQLNNIELAINALKLCNVLKCKKFVITGTVAEYVFCNGVMDYNSKPCPNDIYGASKVSAFFFIDVMARQLQQKYNWVIIPSTFGPRRDDNNIITYTIKQLLQGQKPLYGNLEQMWDFLYVEEVVRALRLIAEKGGSGKIYGIGSGNYHKLYEYIYIIRDLINPKMELGIGSVPSISKQTVSSCVDIYDLRRDTGFVPKISFEKGIMLTIEYLKSRIIRGV